MFKQLVTAIYNAPDIEKAKAWYSDVLGIKPYFDEAFYVGFNVGGYELGLEPERDPSQGLQGLGGSVPYWRVDNIEAAFKRLLELGATVINPIADVGDGIKVAIVKDPFGNALGVIQNPHFNAG
jgi:predicted enzyme related to lactoylglutathione lyase